MQFAKNIIKRLLGRPVRPSSSKPDELNRFKSIKAQAKGMQSPAAYKALYDMAAGLPDLDIVEVGGAAGASSICLALGLKESGKGSRVVMAEKCEGGSRMEIGDYDTNYNLLTSNIQAFGVADQIALFPHYLTFDNADDFKALVQTEQIGTLVHDADGRIDRDFYLFWERLPENAPIVIDDYEEKPQFRAISDRYPDGGTKKLTTYRLTNLFVEWGLFEIDQVIGNTAFGHKPAGADFDKLNLETCQAVIDEIMQERQAYLDNQASA